MITDKFKTQIFHKIAEDALKPMSIIEIKERFNLSFPFKVKRVKDSIGKGAWQGVTVITLIKPCTIKGDHGYGTNNTRVMPTGRNGIQRADVQDYILYEE